MYNVAVVHKALQRRGEPWKWGVQQLAMESWQQPTKRVTTANPLTIAKEVAEKLSINHSMVIWHLKQTRKVKKFNKWVPHELTRNNNNNNNNNKSLFWSVIFSYSTQLLTISPSDCDVQCKVGFIRWLSVSSSVVGLRRSSKPLSKPKLAPKKMVMATVRWSTVSLIHYSFSESQ